MINKAIKTSYSLLDKVIFGVLILILILLSTSCKQTRSDLKKITSDARNSDLPKLWNELQRTETLLVQTSRVLNQERVSNIFQHVNIERPLLVLLLRTTFGLDNDGFLALDYYIRYPFSSIERINTQLNKLVELAYLNKKDSLSEFIVEPKGLELVTHYMNETGAMIQSLCIPEISENQISTIIELDYKILNSLISNKDSNKSPILTNRLQGLQPDYSDRKLWHHWQLIWTILAALEDEDERVRQERKIDPFAWTIRKNLWFMNRKPWLSGPQDSAAFVNHFFSLCTSSQYRN